MSSCQKQLSDFSAEKQIFDPASLLRYLSAAADNPSAFPSFHLTFLCVLFVFCVRGEYI